MSTTHSTAVHPKGTSYGDAEASPSGRSTQSAWKQCGARHARLNRVKCTVARPKEVPLGEGGSHKARQNGPKHYSGDPTGAAAPLVCLSPLSFFKQRKMVPPEGASYRTRPVKTYNPIKNPTNSPLVFRLDFCYNPHRGENYAHQHRQPDLHH